MRYRLSKILAAIADDKDTDNEGAVECAGTVATAALAEEGA